MAKRKQIESAAGDPVANPDNAPQQGQTELPLVDSPSLSPATSDVASEPAGGARYPRNRTGGQQGAHR